MIAYQKEHHMGQVTTHQWTEIGDGQWRTICRHWIEPRENLIEAPAVGCEWCLGRLRARAQHPSTNEEKL